MRSFFINYATPNFAKAQESSKKCAEEAKFDVILTFGPQDIDKDFATRHSLILSQKQGAGCCLWKSYFIQQTMIERMKYGDFILYMDSSDVFNPSLKDYALSHLNDQGQFFIQTKFENKAYIRKKCFEVMGLDEPKYWNGCQIEAGCLGFIKNKYNLQFIARWFVWNTIPDAAIKPEAQDPGGDTKYIRHSCDQSILSLLVLKHDLKTADSSAAQHINYNLFG